MATLTQVPVSDRALGKVDVNVKPKDAAIYVDGGYMGITGSFDGYPGYLWLDEGMHQLVFFKTGYETVAQDVRVIPGNVVDMRFKMQKGTAIAPQGLFKAPEPLAEQQVSQGEVNTEEDWRQRTPGTRGQGRSEIPSDAPSLRIDVEPDEASVYLDGQFLGIGRQIVGVLIEPGFHRLEVIYPGRETHSQDFEARPGKEIEIRVSLRSPEV